MKFYIKQIPPYQLDPILCKTPSYTTTHNTDYKININNKLYSNIKSKYRNKMIKLVLLGTDCAILQQ